jgi:7,8-dihydropterin-6-yl-methyl-4-(beta-D-ribofuranosyl)aminobenzene 5'-phosphate synthase
MRRSREAPPASKTRSLLMKILCLVDNSVQPLSTFWGEHGLSFLIETGNHRVLFDTGASGSVLLHNLEKAGVSPTSIGALVLSHSHPDHSGGLPALLERREGIPTYAHPDLLRPRYSRKNGRMHPKWLPMSPDTLRERTQLHLSTAPQEIVPGIWASGEITPRSEPEGRSVNHYIRSSEDEDWVPDPYTDDMSLILETQAGLHLVCGCCHAGLLNTISTVQRVFNEYPTAILGGTHLIGTNDAQLLHTIERLSQMGSPSLHLNHCTGDRALAKLFQTFGDRVSHCPAGVTLELS